MIKYRHLSIFLLITCLFLAACMPIQPQGTTTPVTNSAPATSTKSDVNTTVNTITDPLNVFAINQRLGRGVNLGNALESPNYEGEWGVELSEKYFTVIAEAGFSSVRVPIRWSAHAQATTPFTIDELFFERIDWVIAQAKANGLAAVINMHHYEEMMVDPEAHTERFLALWQQIGERYKDEPETIVFELLNEPNGALSSTRWNTILAQGVETVRKSNPTRAIVVGPIEWNSFKALNTLQLPDDPFLIVTYHYYEPFQFTHQGAEWVTGADAWLGTTWPANSSQKATLAYHFDSAQKWAEKANRPLFLGEFGAYSKADMESRQLWTTAVVQAAQKRNISMSYWEFGAGFGVFDRDRNQWNEPLLEALLK